VDKGKIIQVYGSGSLVFRPAPVLLFAVLALLCAAATGGAADITTINYRQVNRDVVVNTFLQFDEKIIDDINEGLPKEITFTVSLVKNRRLWPNEISQARVIVRSLRSNPIKREYIGENSSDGEKRVMRFRDAGSMIAWGGSIRELKLSDVDIEEDAEYFIRITAESRMLALPSVVDALLFFIPTREFSVTKETGLFRLTPAQTSR
jgi:hypothetical protein